MKQIDPKFILLYSFLNAYKRLALFKSLDNFNSLKFIIL